MSESNRVTHPRWVEERPGGEIEEPDDENMAAEEDRIDEDVL